MVKDGVDHQLECAESKTLGQIRPAKKTGSLTAHHNQTWPQDNISFYRPAVLRQQQAMLLKPYAHKPYVHKAMFTNPMFTNPMLTNPMFTDPMCTDPAKYRWNCRPHLLECTRGPQIAELDRFDRIVPVDGILYTQEVRSCTRDDSLTFTANRDIHTKSRVRICHGGTTRRRIHD